jgi:hypothetical protein
MFFYAVALDIVTVIVVGHIVFVYALVKHRIGPLNVVCLIFFVVCLDFSSAAFSEEGGSKVLLVPLVPGCTIGGEENKVTESLRASKGSLLQPPVPVVAATASAARALAFAQLGLSPGQAPVHCLSHLALSGYLPEIRRFRL